MQDRDVEKQDLSKLVYLEAVMKEAMRYYVMAPFVGRYIDKEVQLSKNYIFKNILYIFHVIIHVNKV